MNQAEEATFEEALEGEDRETIMEEIYYINKRIREILRDGVKDTEDKEKVKAEITRIYALVAKGLVNLDYNGRRTLNQILKFCNSPTTPSS